MSSWRVPVESKQLGERWSFLIKSLPSWGSIWINTSCNWLRKVSYKWFVVIFLYGGTNNAISLDPKSSPLTLNFDDIIFWLHDMQLKITMIRDSHSGQQSISIDDLYSQNETNKRKGHSDFTCDWIGPNFSGWVMWISTWQKATKFSLNLGQEWWFYLSERLTKDPKFSWDVQITKEFRFRILGL